MQQVYEQRLTQAKQPLSLMEHGFVRHLYKRCRLNGKKLEDCAVIENKKKTGTKLTDTQSEKLNKKAEFQAAIDQDLVTLDLFLAHHVEPKPAVVEEPQEEPVPAAEEVKETVEALPEKTPVPVIEEPLVVTPAPEVVPVDHSQFVEDAVLLICNLVKVSGMQHSFTDVPMDEIFNLMMFYTSLTMKPRETMTADLMKMLRESEEVAITLPSLVKVTYAQVYNILQKISRSQAQPAGIMGMLPQGAGMPQMPMMPQMPQMPQGAGMPQMPMMNMPPVPGQFQAAPVVPSQIESVSVPAEPELEKSASAKQAEDIVEAVLAKEEEDEEIVAAAQEEPTHKDEEPHHQDASVVDAEKPVDQQQEEVKDSPDQVAQNQNEFHGGYDSRRGKNQYVGYKGPYTRGPWRGTGRGFRRGNYYPPGGNQGEHQEGTEEGQQMDQQQQYSGGYRGRQNNYRGNNDNFRGGNSENYRGGDNYRGRGHYNPNYRRQYDQEFQQNREPTDDFQTVQDPTEQRQRGGFRGGYRGTRGGNEGYYRGGRGGTNENYRGRGGYNTFHKGYVSGNREIGTRGNLEQDPNAAATATHHSEQAADQQQQNQSQN